LTPEVDCLKGRHRHRGKIRQKARQLEIRFILKDFA
jgi:hypothetical protein